MTTLGHTGALTGTCVLLQTLCGGLHTTALTPGMCPRSVSNNEYYVCALHLHDRSLLAAAEIVQPLFAAQHAALPTCMLHGDLNEHNLLVDGDDIVGILDVGDCHHGWRVAELGVACTYQAGLAIAGVENAGDVLRVGMEAAADVLVRRDVVFWCGARQAPGWLCGGHQVDRR